MHKNLMLRALSVVMALVLSLSGLVIASADEAEKVNGAAAIMATASSQVGYTEGAGDYTKYGAYFNYQGPWCGAFVSWCARTTGIPQDVIPTNLSSTAMRDYFKSKGLYHLSVSYGGSYTPKQGDIVFFTSTNTYQRSQNNITHVGLVLEATSSYVTCIEGNCPDRVRQIDRKYTNYITGFATPRYEGIELEDTTPSNTYKAGTYETKEIMNFRQEPGSTVLCTIPAGTLLQITAIEGVWGKTVYEGKTGWISLEYSEYKPTTDTPPTEDNENNENEAPGSPVTPKPNKQYRVTEDMNMRESYTTSSKILTRIPEGTLVEVLEVTSDNWGKVSFNGFTGWISLNWSVEFEPEVDWLVMDISYSQAPEDLDWAKLRSEGVQGVIIRVGGRGSANGRKIYSDQSFLQHYKAAKAADMHIGVYFFSYALTKAEAIEEAQYTLDVLKINNCQLDLPVYIDMEDFGRDTSHLKAGKEVCSMVLNEFCKTIEAAGYMAGIYVSSSFAETHVKPETFDGRSAWIAEWDTDVCCYNGRVDMWQYTENGRLKGASNKDIDLNRLYVDYPALINGERFENGLLNDGDLDFDGKLTAADSRLALRFSVSLDNPTSLQLKVGDINKNGKIDSTDSREILLKAVS
ncbi:MAG: SH3 domain-containing protein [Clostridia bacterium]|nr:SH3 domain-containing protein [Clostridia bacterium]